ncbi:MAG: hypothetical protein P4M08_15955 [Oligoflexia bacterium]|nr:hypothetical protein [Oligoflexia bacterium]
MKSRKRGVEIRAFQRSARARAEPAKRAEIRALERVTALGSQGGHKDWCWYCGIRSD